ncbi:MAG TPA: Ig-like domain-containing protein [Solirubrobacteraceae bacterium]
MSAFEAHGRQEQFERERALLAMRTTVTAAVLAQAPSAGSSAIADAVDEALAQLVAAGQHLGEPKRVKDSWILYAKHRLLNEQQSAAARRRDPVAIDDHAQALSLSASADFTEDDSEESRAAWRVRELLSQLRGDQRRWAEAWYDQILSGSLPPGGQPRGLAEALGWNAEKTKKVSQRARRRMAEFADQRARGEVCSDRLAGLDDFILATADRRGDGLSTALDQARYEQVLFHIAGCEDCWAAWKARRRTLRERAIALLTMPFGWFSGGAQALRGKLSGFFGGAHGGVGATSAAAGVASVGGNAGGICLAVVCAVVAAGAAVAIAAPAMLAGSAHRAAHPPTAARLTVADAPVRPAHEHHAARVPRPTHVRSSNGGARTNPNSGSSSASATRSSVRPAIARAAAVAPADSPPTFGAPQDIANTAYQLNAVACSSAHDCVAVGPNAAQSAGAVVPITDGVPGSEQDVAGLGNPQLSTVACDSGGSDCYAVADGSPDTELVPIDAGVPEADAPLENFSASAFACPPGSDQCAAVGDGPAPTYTNEFVPVDHGVPQTPIDLPAAINPFYVACWAVGDCLVEGADTNGDADFVTVTGDTVSAVQSLGLSSSQQVLALTCYGPGNCFAAGEDNGPSEGLIAPIVNGTPQTPVQVAGTVQLTAITCPPGSSDCVAVGQGTDNNGDGAAALVTVHQDGTLGAVQYDPNIFNVSVFGGIACMTATSCVATASDSEATGTFGSITLLTLSAPVIGPPTVTIAAPTDGQKYPANDPSDPTFQFSCAADTGATITGCSGAVTTASAVVGVSSGDPVDTSKPGAYKFTVSATQSDGQTATATHSYGVLSPAAPTCSDGSYSLPATGGTVGLACDQQFNPVDPVTCTVLSGPSQGSLSSFNGLPCAFTYTPSAGNNGSDSFTFKATNSEGDSNTATDTISIAAPAPPPTVTITTPVQGGVYPTNGPAAFDFSCQAGAGTSVTSCIGTVEGQTVFPGRPLTGATGNAGNVGSHTLSVTATDNDGQVATQSVTYSIETGQTITFPPLGPYTFGQAPVVLAATSTSTLPVSYTVVSGPCTVDSPTATLTFTGSGSCVVAADQAGNGTFAPAPTVQQTIIVGAATPPTCQSQNLNFPFGATSTVTLVCSDAAGDSGDPLTYHVVTQPANGTLSAGGAPGSVVYTPTAGFSGADGFTFDATDGQGTSNTATVSIVTAAEVAPANTTPPAVSGSPAVGQTLTCTPGVWSGGTPQTDAYQWLRDAEAITGATSSTYAVAAADQGHTLTCAVTTTNSGGNATATSAGVAIPAASPVTTPPPVVPPATAPVNGALPGISGTAKLGFSVSCSQGVWSGTMPQTYAYQWKRDGAAIAGATGVKLVIATGDLGHSLTCAVTSSNSAGRATAASASLAVPLPSNTFTFASKAKASKTGTITLAVQAPGSGHFSIRATFVSTATNTATTAKAKSVKIVYGKGTATARHAGSVALTVRPTKAAASRLKKARRLAVAITVTFTPTGGKARAKASHLTVKHA